MTLGRGIFLAYILIAIMFAAYRYACGEAINWRMTFCIVWPLTFGLLVCVKLAHLIGGKDTGVIPMRNTSPLGPTGSFDVAVHNCVPPPEPFLTFDLYQELAARTINKDITNNEALSLFALGLGGEAGEAIDIIKKHLFHGHSLDKNKMTGELGDLMWYVAGMARQLGIPLHEVAVQNIDKLKRRYPDGFSNEASINRTE